MSEKELDIEHLEKLKKLKDKGMLTEEEFQESKKQLLQSLGSKKSEEKVKKKSNPVLVIIGWLFILGLVVHILNPEESKKHTSSPTSTPVEQIKFEEVSVYDMMGALKINAARAQQTYKGKYVNFAGTLSNIDADGDYFNIETGELLAGIQCYIKDAKNRQIIINKNIGNRVRVKGLIKRVGETLGYSVDVISVE